LLEGLNPEQVVAAQVVSTQLESSELLQAILMAFGIPSSSTSKAHLIANLEAFLTALAAKGRRALLIIDEAQNLKHEAVEELRMLSNFQLGKYGLLQSFLVGQPELRALLQSKSMEQLRQRVIASCHLGPLDQAETLAYVEHRLRRVGWNGKTPELGAKVLERIHYWTGGVPRKINRLCNRLLLGAFLGNVNAISLALVDETAAELRNEIGEAVMESPPVAAASPGVEAAPAMAQGPSAPATIRPPPDAIDSNPAIAAPSSAALPGASPDPVSTTASLPPHALSAAATAHVATAEAAVPPLTSAPQRRIHRPGHAQHPLLCVAHSPTDYVKAGALALAFQGFPSLPPVVVIHSGREDELGLDDNDMLKLPMPAMALHLGLSARTYPELTSLAMLAIDAVLNEFDPQCVALMGESDVDLACALLATKRGVRLLRFNSEERSASRANNEQTNAKLIDRVADQIFTSKSETYYSLYREGVHLDRVHSVGNLTGEMLSLVLTHAAPSGANPVGPGSNFALVAIDPFKDAWAAHTADDLADTICAVSKELPVIWSLADSSITQLNASALAAKLRAHRVTIVGQQGYLHTLGLLRGARCVITSRRGALLDEALSLHICVLNIDLFPRTSTQPQSEAFVLALRERLLAGPPPADSPEYWDVGTANRIARQLITSLPGRDAKPAVLLFRPEVSESAS
jgi:general secretion pathway protein A